MARKRKGDPVNGWINLDKPLGLTSTQAMSRVRKFFNAQKAGHAGTLDPLATGILPIALGEATKTIPFIQDSLKTYAFTVHWGEQRDTDDSEGQVINTSAGRPDRATILRTLPKYTGDIMQTPPKFSAIKINGRRAYDLARAGEVLDLNPREVFIETLEMLHTTANETSFRMVCGKGTYVRSLARDMALDLGTYGYISALKREKVGPFMLENAISLDKLEAMDNIAALNNALLPLQTALDDIPALAIREEETAKLRNGQTLSFVARPDVERLKNAGLDIGEENKDALVLYKGKPIALVQVSGVQIKPIRVLNL